MLIIPFYLRIRVLGLLFARGMTVRTTIPLDWSRVKYWDRHIVFDESLRVSRLSDKSRLCLTILIQIKIPFQRSPVNG